MRIRQAPAILLAVFWTILVLLFALQEDNFSERTVLELALTELRASYHKDLVYRRWSATHGGVYVPVTAQTPPNPYLTSVAERDIETPSGKKLTLMNPAYMTRQVHEIARGPYGVKGHITSLKPLRPENGPDPWEQQALVSFEQGATVAQSVEELDGEPYLRAMFPFVTEQSCLKCHEEQGYSVGDIRGGISVSVPLQPFLDIHHSGMQQSIIHYGTIWLLGMGAFLFARAKISSQFQTIQAKLEETEQLKQRLEHKTYGLEKTQQLGKIGTWDLDLTTESLEWSDETCRIFGISPGTIMTYEKFLEIVHADDRNYVEQEWTKALAGTPYDIEHRVFVGGELKWVREKAEVTFDPNGNPIKAIGFTQEITVRKAFEIALRESEERFKSLFRRHDAPMLLIDPVSGRIIDANDAACDYYGYPLERFKELLINDINTLDHSDAYSARTRALSGTQNFFEFQHRLASGAVRDVGVHSSPIRMNDQTLLFSIVQDITEQKTARSALRESEKSYRALFEEAAHGAAVVDFETGVFLACNQQLARLVECDTGDLVGKPHTVLHPEGMRNRMPVEKFPQHDEIHQTKIVTGSGKILDVEVKASRVAMSGREVLYLFFYDVTEKKRLLAEQMRSAQLAAIGRLAANIAHEINNPAQAIVSFSELIEESAGRPDLVKDLAGRITREGMKIGELVKSSLHYTRKGDAQLQRLSLSELVNNALILFKGKLHKENIAIEVNIPADHPKIKACGREIEQVIINLVSNAIDAFNLNDSPQSENHIRINGSMSPAGEWVELIVEDNGPGIPNTILSSVKDAFFTTKPEEQGSGLGLSIVDDIMRRHGGNFIIESEEGKGTKGVLQFPVETS